MSIVEKHLSLGQQCLIYADDLVIFISNNDLNLAIENLTSALKDLSDILTSVSFEVVSVKSKSVIFTRFKYLNHSNILLYTNRSKCHIFRYHSWLQISLASVTQFAYSVRVSMV